MTGYEMIIASALVLLLLIYWSMHSEIDEILKLNSRREYEYQEMKKKLETLDFYRKQDALRVSTNTQNVERNANRIARLEQMVENIKEHPKETFNDEAFDV